MQAAIQDAAERRAAMRAMSTDRRIRAIRDRQTQNRAKQLLNVHLDEMGRPKSPKAAAVVNDMDRGVTHHGRVESVVENPDGSMTRRVVDPGTREEFNGNAMGRQADAMSLVYAAQDAPPGQQEAVMQDMLMQKRAKDYVENKISAEMAGPDAVQTGRAMMAALGESPMW